MIIVGPRVPSGRIGGENPGVEAESPGRTTEETPGQNGRAEEEKEGGMGEGERTIFHHWLRRKKESQCVFCHRRSGSSHCSLELFLR